MILTSLQTNQLSEQATAWYWSFLLATSAREAEPMLDFFNTDATLQLNNRVPAHGRRAIGAELSRYWDGIAGVEHEPITILGTDHQFSVEMFAHYTLKSGEKIIVPASGFLDRNSDGLIQSLRLFGDVRPVFKASA